MAGTPSASNQRVIIVQPPSADPIVIELRTGLWMVKLAGTEDEPGVIRGYINAVEAPDGRRFLARLPHLNPTQGIRLGEFWELDRAVAAVLAEQPRPLVADPWRDGRYSDPAELRRRLEGNRRRRRLATWRVE